jgi:RND family efflux transporter MFP subunit
MGTPCSWVVSALLVSVGLVAGCGRNAGPATDEVRPFGVNVHVVRTETIRDVASASGTVVPSTSGDWTIFAPEGATVAEIPKQETETVAIGDVLVRFDVASIAQEVAARQLAVTEASNRAERAKTEVARLSSLVDRGIVPRNTYEAARAEQTSATSILGQSIAQLDMAKADETRATIRARFPGVVLKVWHTAGDAVRNDGSDPILRIIDPTRVQVAVQLPVAQLARVLPGQTAVVRPIAAAESLAGTVVFKPATTDPNAPTGEVRVAFNDLASVPLDTPASVEILLDQRNDALTVPIEAVLRESATSYVMVAGDDQRAHRRAIRTGLVTRTVAQVIDGLSAGERVIIGNVADVADGAAIAFAP